MLKYIAKKFFNARNYAISTVTNIKTPTAVYNNWTVEKAVKEGYGFNTWVYRSVNLVVKNLASIPWVVRDENEVKPEHHISKVLSKPNPSVSSNDLWELLISWLELAGNGYAVKVKVAGETQELWPVSPDRIHPVQSPTVTEWMQGYVVDPNQKGEQKFEPEAVLHLKFFNPANPLLGIGPLQAVAKTVDIDNDQQNWSKSTMQNRGVIDGVMTFERPFDNEDDADAISKRINKKYGGSDNARKIAVLGGNAKYHRTAITPQESDFSASRKDNRDEIFIAFGVPPQLGGSQEASTYNNYETSILIFWFSTLIPILDDIKATLNFNFEDELAPDETICYDLSNVKAIRKAMLDQAETANILFSMGVPFEKVNRIFEFGVEEFDGWNKSYIKTAGSKIAEEVNPETEEEERAEPNPFKLVHKRAAGDTETAIEKAAEENAPTFEVLLKEWQDKIFDAIDRGEAQDATKILDETKDEWLKAIGSLYIETGTVFGMDIVEPPRSNPVKMSYRAAEDVLSQSILNYLEAETAVLIEFSHIASTTAALITQHVAEGLVEGYTATQTQQALIDSGIFSESRALMLSRTITGTAANLGQWRAATITGATHKTWITAGFEVRDTHIPMNNVKKPINEVFTVGGELARYPLDNALSPKERVNCRCTLVYSIED